MLEVTKRQPRCLRPQSRHRERQGTPGSESSVRRFPNERIQWLSAS